MSNSAAVHESEFAGECGRGAVHRSCALKSFLAFLILLIGAGALAGAAEPLRYYLSPDGQDSNSGESAAEPLRTLVRVHQLLVLAKPQRDVEVLIAPGLYQGQRTVWTYTHPNYSITFKPDSPDSPMPVFDGGVPDGQGGFDYPGGTWFRLNHSAGQATNLVFHRLRIQNYWDAISFNGNRNSQSAFNGRNIIRECYFYRIGNIVNPSLNGSTACIRFVNSKFNIVENNDFVDLINTTGGGLLHATYIAHLSDKNQIHRNRFINHTGDPVRVRDYSNFNDVGDNVYIRAGTGGGYTEWYCDHDTRTDCTKPGGECPSWENEFRYNFLVSTYTGGRLPAFQYFQDDEASGCLSPFEGARRLSTSGNTRPAGFSPYELWRHRYFAPDERDQPAAAPAAAPMGDGLPNLLKFAFGLDPRRVTPRSLYPELSRNGEGDIVLIHPLDPEAEGVNVVIDESTNLSDWHPVSRLLEETYIQNGRTWRRLTDSQPAAAAPRRFYRVRAVVAE